MAIKISRSTMGRFTRIAFVVVWLVGIVFVAVGIGLLVTRGWDTADGTVQSCRSRIVHTGGSSTSGGSSHTETTCDVTWADSTGPHTAAVDLGRGQAQPGQTVHLRVHGDSAALDSPIWVALGILGLGAVLVIVAVVKVLRLRTKSVSGA